MEQRQDGLRAVKEAMSHHATAAGAEGRAVKEAMSHHATAAGAEGGGATRAPEDERPCRALGPTGHGDGHRPERDLLDAVLKTSVAAITILNTSGQIVFANDRAEEILGLRKDELLELHYNAPEWRSTAPDGGPWPDEKHPFTIVMRTGAPVTDIRHAIVWPSGARKLLSINGAPIKNAAGNIASVVFSVADITARVRKEQILQRIVESTATTGRAYLESIVRAMAETLDVSHALIAELVDGETRARTVAAWMNGALVDPIEYDLAGTPCERVLERTSCFYRDSVQQRFPEDLMLQEIHAECYLGVALRSPSGRLLGLMAVLNATPLDEALQPEAILSIFAGKVAAELERKHAEEERRALEAQLFQAQKMESVGRLAGGVAHDFNNLLTAILCYGELCLQRAAPGSPSQEHLQQIIEAGKRGARLTRQLLAFARKQVIESRVIDLDELVAGAAEMLRRLIGEDIDLVCVRTEGLGRVRADPGQIEQILMNLAVNARDAMPGGGRLTIETADATLSEEYTDLRADIAPGDYVMLAVTDAGQGISPEQLPLIFEPFYTTKAAGEGTGLGLATCYGIVKQHRGHIAVYSEPGRGTIFKVYLPRVREEATPPERRPEDGVTVTGDETVLVVEDYATLRAMARDVLSSLGYRVLTAADGEEALEVARAHAGPIHLLVTDVIMPRMGGKELAEVLRLERPELGVLYSSGYTESTILHQGVLGPGAPFIQKPYRLMGLAQRVRAVLDARSPGESGDSS